jgi:hypothetical protein
MDTFLKSKATPQRSSEEKWHTRRNTGNWRYFKNQMRKTNANRMTLTETPLET